MRDQKPTSQTLISREFHLGPHTTYDQILETMRWSGPNISHNFYKCFNKRRDKAEQYLKDHKHDAFSTPARHIIEEQK